MPIEINGSIKKEIFFREKPHRKDVLNEMDENEDRWIPTENYLLIKIDTIVSFFSLM
jgi:hypothetical protein